MRRTYISSEYNNTKTYGTFNMLEESNYFGSKMLEIEDTIYIENQNIIYYQQSSGEQINLSTETSIDSLVYSAASDKEINHSLVIDDAQTEYQRENSTKWIMNINLDDILSNFLFASLKRYRTFEGMKTSLTRTNDVNTAIREYIDKNVSNRYKLNKVDFYIKYKDLRSQNVLRFKNTWNPTIGIDSNKFQKIQTETAFDGSSIRLLFNQEQPSTQYSFEYYFNILFEKI
jgi:hypothetical protein